MKALLVYPEFPDTFWNFKRALKFVSKKASFPPLGLLTVASMLPQDWEVRLADLNVSPLGDADLEGVGLVFIGAISVQKKSAEEVIARCKRAGITTVCGGPLFTTGHEEFPDADHFVLDEAELTLPLFLGDLARGAPRRVYTSPLRADAAATPLPRWDLIEMKHYASMNVQYSRGCPFNCDFCDITRLYGRQSRTKNREQVLAELDALYARGWRGPVFFVDDNFIGNKEKLKTEVLPAITAWMARRRFPFVFNTQASVNLADDPELMRLMTDAGFVTVFVGIETPCEESLSECNKAQNRRRDLLGSVRKILASGLEVQGGFIVGFDHDPPSIFERQIHFIQESGIVTAMVGLLNALRGTTLYRRMQEENRLLHENGGDNTNGTINFIPKMDKRALTDGYKKIVSTIYAPRHYYRRIRNFLTQYNPPRAKLSIVRFHSIMAFLRSIVLLGIAGAERVYYWKLLFWTLFRKPRLFPQAVTFAIYGYHYRKIFERLSQAAASLKPGQTEDTAA